MHYFVFSKFRSDPATICDTCSQRVSYFSVFLCIIYSILLHGYNFITYKNKSQGEYNAMDVTDICKKTLEGIKVINAVGDRAGRGRMKTSGFTLKYFVDLLKGSEHKKITDLGKLSISLQVFLYYF